MQKKTVIIHKIITVYCCADEGTRTHKPRGTGS